jgi:Protein of unknown function (DUF3429)
MPEKMPPIARWLGFLGLFPQAAALLVVLMDEPRTLFSALALAFAYAALVLSFLGGAWWGFACAARQVPRWLWFAAMVPRLVALASCIPWATAGAWPGPSLILLGAAMIAALPVDQRLVALGLAPSWWMKLRAPLTVGLGGMTIALGLLAFR